jgi:hypothetical protein
MKEKNRYLLRAIVGFFCLFLVVNGIVVFGTYLLEEGRKEYNNFCISKGNEKFLSIDDGHIKCYREDKLALYEEYIRNWKYDLGEMLSILITANIFFVLGGVMVWFNYMTWDAEEEGDSQ